MRLCQGLLCDEAADLFYHGPWCVACCLKRYGKKTIALEARLGELRHALKEVAPPSAAPGVGSVRERPSSAGPAPLSDGDIEQLLARHNWDLLDLEWALVAHLEEP